MNFVLFLLATGQFLTASLFDCDFVEYFVCTSMPSKLWWCFHMYGIGGSNVYMSLYE